MASPFGKPCPWEGCDQVITKATGDVDGDSFSVRCGVAGDTPDDFVLEVEHRSHAKRSGKGRLTLTPDPEDESLEGLVPVHEPYVEPEPPEEDDGGE